MPRFSSIQNDFYIKLTTQYCLFEKIYELVREIFETTGFIDVIVVR